MSLDNKAILETDIIAAMTVSRSRISPNDDPIVALVEFAHALAEAINRYVDVEIFESDIDGGFPNSVYFNP